ncbi:elongation factor 4 [Striga asiatica]|uniref:Elongation factor 4 n=1 Tax=Striga asiatica TaxID=4170 RepID=A0A5A7Q1A6_STRAF|nr:elongation factor 4 [Striga asiatica]
MKWGAVWFITGDWNDLCKWEDKKVGKPDFKEETEIGRLRTKFKKSLMKLIFLRKIIGNKKQELSTQRRKMNSIVRLVTKGNMIISESVEIKQIVADYYEKLFTSNNSSRGHELLPLISKSVTEDMKSALTAPVENEDIKKVVFSIHPDKAPG